VWRVRAVATGTVRWSLDTAHHGFDTMGPCVIAPESGKVKLKGFGLKSKRVESGARVGRSASRRRRPAAASRPSGRGELRDHDTLTIAAEKITFATRNRGNPSGVWPLGAGEGAPRLALRPRRSRGRKHTLRQAVPSARPHRATTDVTGGTVE